MLRTLTLCLLCAAAPARAQDDAFRQLDEILPSPNVYRAASGAPGPQYWQQRADYEIDVELDDVNQRIRGSERITYHNNAPLPLEYLWVALDGNLFEPDSDNVLVRTAPSFERFPYRRLRALLAREQFDGGFKVSNVRGADGVPLPHVVNKTMMRIDLPRPLATGAAVTFSLDWEYAINEHRSVGGRTGYELFEEDGNYLYEMAQWFPRMASYTDYAGWQNKQFLGSGEFTLEFGDYTVRITVPEDHVVASTGVLQNPESVLTAVQRERLAEARSSDRPVFVVTPDEALENEKSRARGTRTWVFEAENVRDFAWASSRKFIWDAVGHDVGDRNVLCMSFYPKEGEPLWSRYSTHSIVHTLEVYSRFTFDYPYPVAISVNGPVGGMEYPMICFNGPRPEKDGTYTERTKYGLISVIIHEVGHNYFPMIVNSDERQWTWMDEGLNTFVQTLAEREWEDEYPSWYGTPSDLSAYMASENQVPIMTNSESIPQFGNNAYGKPTAALQVLRETVMGRELFDFAFRQYARRWMFKRPEPADFFRTMEDASAVDLDWFWRGWFYTTDHVDLSIAGVRHYVLERRDPETDKALAREERDAEPEYVAHTLDRPVPKRVDAFPELKDFYNEYDELDVTRQDREAFEELLAGLDEEEQELLALDRHFYVVDLENVGGLVMPVILEIEHESGAIEELRIPAEIWRMDRKRCSKLLMPSEPIVRITLDPRRETGEVDLANNSWPREPVKSRFQLFKEKQGKNPMQKAREAEEKAAAEEGEQGDSE